MRARSLRSRLPLKSMLALGKGTVIFVGFGRQSIDWPRPFVRASKTTLSRSGNSGATVLLLRFLVFAKFVTYGYKVNGKIIAFTKKSKRAVFYEDGFIRSFWAPEGNAPSPARACLDRKGLHFDGGVVTDFDVLLNSNLNRTGFVGDSILWKRGWNHGQKRENRATLFA